MVIESGLVSSTGRLKTESLIEKRILHVATLAAGFTDDNRRWRVGRSPERALRCTFGCPNSTAQAPKFPIPDKSGRNLTF
jgi:hypothetical protein